MIPKAKNYDKIEFYSFFFIFAMTFSSLPNDFNSMDQVEDELSAGDPGLQRFATRLNSNVERDQLIQQELDQIRNYLEVDRVVIYYFYYPWKGQVTFESLRELSFSIYGSTGADECFNDQYSQHYKMGRIRAIEDIETEPIHECHRDFLRSLNVKANLVFPILVADQLWGLLIAHQCQKPRFWAAPDLEEMKKTAARLAIALKNFNL